MTIVFWLLILSECRSLKMKYPPRLRHMNTWFPVGCTDNGIFSSWTLWNVVYRWVWALGIYCLTSFTVFSFVSVVGEISFKLLVLANWCHAPHSSFTIMKDEPKSTLFSLSCFFMNFSYSNRKEYSAYLLNDIKDALEAWWTLHQALTSFPLAFVYIFYYHWIFPHGYQIFFIVKMFI